MMSINDLMGSEVIIGYGRERSGCIVSVTGIDLSEGIVASANESSFIVRRDDGELVQTSGLNIFFMHPGYIAESPKSDGYHPSGTYA